MRRVCVTGAFVAVLAGALPAGAAAATPAPGSVVTTGNVLVLLDTGRAAAAAGQTAIAATAARLGARRAGRSVPEIGLITLRPPAGVGAAAFAASLRGLPGVASVELEHRLVPRSLPNDPALTAPDPSSGVVEWELAREGFYNAWNITHGDGALVGVIDTGIDGTHADLASKIADAIDQQDPSDARGTARTDEVGHGTHVSSLACAATNNGIGMAGAGYNCNLLLEKTDFSDSSIDAAIVDAANRHVGALNMSFGPTQCVSQATAAEVRALNYAAARKVVLVAAAADQPCTEQGDPADVLQPAGTGSDITQGIGLDVTAADYAGGRADFAGFGSEISLAAFGSLNPDATSAPPFCPPPKPGLLGAIPPFPTDLDNPVSGGPLCRTTMNGANYAYLQGTSMAAPQVAAAGALMRELNPFATLADVLKTLKLTAQRPAGSGFGGDLGWGILNAGAALEVIRSVDRLPPVSKLRAPRVSHRRNIQLRWSGHDQQWPQLIASGIAKFKVYLRLGRHRSRLLVTTKRHKFTFHGKPGQNYAFYVVAIDKAGNREQKPAVMRTRVVAGAR